MTSKVSLATRLARLDDAALEVAEEHAGALAHDVGKYAVRVARNVLAGDPVPIALAPMLVKDLFETHRGQRASRRFADLARGLPEGLREADEIVESRALLAEIDGLEGSVRAADPAALCRAVAAALALESALSRLAHAVRTELAERRAAGPSCLPRRSRQGG
ncbi:MAG: hypothetical protein OHK0013_37890 [Sandaracinaceae bacterium]